MTGEINKSNKKILLGFYFSSLCNLVQNFWCGKYSRNVEVENLNNFLMNRLKRHATLQQRILHEEQLRSRDTDTVLEETM